MMHCDRQNPFVINLRQNRFVLTLIKEKSYCVRVRMVRPLTWSFNYEKLEVELAGYINFNV